MNKKIVSLLTVIFVMLSATGCQSYEISRKLVSDVIVITKDDIILLTDSYTKEPKVYSVPHESFENSMKEIKIKYDQTPFLSHSKDIIISAEITVKELASYIGELKSYYQIPPDIRISLAESPAIDMIKKGEINSDSLNVIIKNSNLCDERICAYSDALFGKEFSLLYEDDGEMNIKRITI
ncbi:MAG: hypothetical protein ACI4RL_04035 [Ruminococcus sp.]